MYQICKPGISDTTDSDPTLTPYAMQKAGTYEVEIYPDDTFTRNSADNLQQYDVAYLGENDYVFPTVIGIRLFKEDRQIKSAVISGHGGGTGIHRTSVVYEEAQLVICCSDSVFCLSFPDLALRWKTKADPATCFEIYQYQDSYIIHGEIAVSRLGSKGQILWQHTGADIFTTVDGECDFEFREEGIIAKDFSGRVYRFGYDGADHTDMD